MDCRHIHDETMVLAMVAELRSILRSLDEAEIARSAAIHIQWASDLLDAHGRSEPDHRLV